MPTPAGTLRADAYGQRISGYKDVMCWNNGESGDDYEEKTFCDVCYFVGGWYRYDRNEDNRDSAIEHKVDIGEDLGPN